MPLSYTRITRFMENPARAFAYYGRSDKDAYDSAESEALIYGTILHDKMAGIKTKLTESQMKLIYVRGQPEKGLKVAFKNIDRVIHALVEQRDLLYQSLGLDYHGKQPHQNTVEVEFKNDYFKGRFDFIDWKNKIIIDWKTVKGNVDYEKEWDDKNSTYDTWIHATHYDIQAFIYLYSLRQWQPDTDWKYYVIAASKSDVPKTRVIDMSALLYQDSLQDEINKVMSEIPEYYKGEQIPEIVNDNSDWYWRNKPFSIEVF